MTNIGFSGYARGRGFQQQQAAYDILGRMAEKDDRVIRSLEQQKSQTDARAAKAERDLERKLDREEQVRRDNQGLEKLYRQQQLQSIEQNQRVEARNAQIREADAVARQKNVGALAKMSMTLSNQLLEMGEQLREKVQEDAYLDAIINGPDIVGQTAYEAKMGQLGETSTQILAAGRAYRSSGAPERVVNFLFGTDKAVQMGRDRAIAEMAANQFASYAQNKLLERNAVTPGQVASELDPITIEFMQENNMYGLSKEFLAPAFLKIRTARASLVAAAEKAEIVQNQAQQRSDALNLLAMKPTPEVLLETMDVVRSTVDERGAVIGRTGALDEVFTLLGDVTLFPTDADIINLLKDTPTDQGSMYERHRIRVDNLLKKRSEDRRSEKQLRDANEVIYHEKVIEAGKNFLQNEWDGTQETLKSVIEQIDATGADSAELKPYLLSGNAARQTSFWKEEFEEQRQNGTLNPNDVYQPWVPLDVQKEYGPIAKTQANNRGGSGMTQADIKASFGAEVNEALGENSLDQSKSGYNEATAFALQRYNRQFQKYIEENGLSSSEAHEKAFLDIKNEIREGLGHFKTRDLYDQLAFGNTRVRGTFFVNFTPRSKDNPEGPVRLNPGTIAERVQANPKYIDETLFVSIQKADALAKMLRDRVPVTVPEIYHRYSRLNPQKYGTPMEAMLKNLESAGGFKGLEKPLDYQAVLNQRASGDPNLQSFTQKLQSLQDVLKVESVLTNGTRQEAAMPGSVGDYYKKTQVMVSPVALQGLSLADYEELAYVVSGEAELGTDDVFAVAASVLNRVADPSFPNTVRGVVRSPGQYEAVTKGTAQYMPDLATELMSEKGQRKIAEALRQLQGRTDFKGQSQLRFRDPSDLMFSEKGNFFHYLGQTPGSGAYQGEINSDYTRFLVEVDDES